MSITRDSALLVARFSTVLLAPLAAPFLGCAATPGPTPVTRAPPLATNSVTNDLAPPQDAGAHRETSRGTPHAAVNVRFVALRFARAHGHGPTSAYWTTLPPTIRKRMVRAKTPRTSDA